MDYYMELTTPFKQYPEVYKVTAKSLHGAFCKLAAFRWEGGFKRLTGFKNVYKSKNMYYTCTLRVLDTPKLKTGIIDL